MMSDLHTILFSKDRACQLDLTLSTYKRHFREWKGNKLTILYTHTNAEYEFGYDRVKMLHPEFNWVKETNFSANTIDIFNSDSSPLVSFLVDDDVFINDVTLASPAVEALLRNKNILCVASRMNKNIDYCYTANIQTPPPGFFFEEGSWEWRVGGLQGDWCYPMSIASFHIFRKMDLIRPINQVPFRAPNSFEGTCLAPNPPDRPLMILMDNQKCVCGVNNRVQTENSNRHEDSHSLDSLNRMFLGGNRLSDKVNDGKIFKQAHAPVEYVWEKR
jgi:hypothetical protein